ncbi:MAG: hypothetical protein ACYDH6_06680 [Acidimicrobiales bacterium]
MRRRALAVPLVAAAIVVAGCSSSSKSSSSSSTTTAGESRTVKVDNSTPQFLGAFLSYFPSQVTVHPGDTVTFDSVFSGDPHSVTFGTLVEKGLAAMVGVDPNSNAAPPAAYNDLPQMLPQGPGDADQRAINPCYVDTSPLPTDTKTSCASTTQPAFNGKQTYYNSGFLAKGATYSVKLASDIAPGTYHYYCNLHGPEMQGSITVAPAATPIPSQADVDAAATAQLAGLVAKVVPAVAAATAGHPELPPTIHVAANLAGLLAQGAQGVGIDQYFPAVIHAKVGQTVSWTIIGAHTITFGAANPPPYPIEKAPDGSYHTSPSAGAPVPPPSGPPPSGNGPAKIDGGTYSGTGLHSSGVQASFPPDLTTYSLKFAKAGTYTYVCLIHPGQVGQVVVS